MKKRNAFLNLCWSLISMSLFLLLFWYSPRFQESFLMKSMGGKSTVGYYFLYFGIVLGIHVLEGLLLCFIIPPWEYRLPTKPTYLLIAGVPVLLLSLVPFMDLLFPKANIFHFLLTQPQILSGIQMILGFLLGILLVSFLSVQRDKRGQKASDT